METVIKYAEEFSKSEKIKRILLFLLLGLLVIIVQKKWILPFIAWYADTVHCHNPLGYSGITVMWYSVFVGFPLFSAMIISAVTVPVGYKGLIDGQFPPKGVKVYKPTKIDFGVKAKIKSIFLLLIPSFLIVITVWGFFQVDKMPQQESDNYDYSVCDSLGLN